MTKFEKSTLERALAKFRAMIKREPPLDQYHDFYIMEQLAKTIDNLQWVEANFRPIQARARFYWALITNTTGL